MSVYRPLFVEVPRSATRPRFGVSDMSSVTALYRALYAPEYKITFTAEPRVITWPPMTAPQVRASSDAGPP